MIIVLSRSLLVAILLSIGYLPAYSQCVDCNPPNVLVLGEQNVVINVPWQGGGPGCFLYVNISTRRCGNRCEVFFNSIERSECCATLFNASTAAALVAHVRDWLFANPQIANPPCAVFRIVHPTCWTKDNAAGTMTACGDPPCCYIQGPVGGASGPVTVLGVGACVLPCIPVCPLP